MGVAWWRFGLMVSLGFLQETGAARWVSRRGSTTGGYLRGSSYFCGVEGVQSMDSGGEVPGAVGFDDRGESKQVVG